MSAWWRLRDSAATDWPVGQFAAELEYAQVIKLREGKVVGFNVLGEDLGERLPGLLEAKSEKK